MTFCIIVPVYQAEKYLQNCIDSILVQTYADFHLILVDDGSTDSSVSICDDYGKRDKRVTVIHQKNEGVSVARNAGIQMAETMQSEYLLFIDADDRIERDWLEKMAKHLHSDVDMVLFDYYEFRDEIIRKQYFKYNEKHMFKKEDTDWYSTIEYLQTSMLYPEIAQMYDSVYSIGVPWGKAYKLQIIKENEIRFDSGLHLNEDVLFNVEFMEKCNNILYIPEACYYYRIFSESSMGKMDAKQETAIDYRVSAIDKLNEIQIKYPHLKRAIQGKKSSLLIQVISYIRQCESRKLDVVSKELRVMLCSADVDMRLKFRIMKKLIFK